MGGGVVGALTTVSRIGLLGDRNCPPVPNDSPKPPEPNSPPVPRGTKKPPLPSGTGLPPLPSGTVFPPVPFGWEPEGEVAEQAVSALTANDARNVPLVSLIRVIVVSSKSPRQARREREGDARVPPAELAQDGRVRGAPKGWGGGGADIPVRPSSPPTLLAGTGISG